MTHQCKPIFVEICQAQGATDGDFMVKRRTQPNEFILVVIFKGKPTHHLLKKDGPSYKVNGKTSTGGATTIKDVR